MFVVILKPAGPITVPTHTFNPLFFSFLILMLDLSNVWIIVIPLPTFTLVTLDSSILEEENENDCPKAYFYSDCEFVFTKGCLMALVRAQQEFLYHFYLIHCKRLEKHVDTDCCLRRVLVLKQNKNNRTETLVWVCWFCFPQQRMRPNLLNCATSTWLCYVSRCIIIWMSCKIIQTARCLNVTLNTDKTAAADKTSSSSEVLVVRSNQSSIFCVCAQTRVCVCLSACVRMSASLSVLCCYLNVYMLVSGQEDTVATFLFVFFVLSAIISGFPLVSFQRLLFQAVSSLEGSSRFLAVSLGLFGPWRPVSVSLRSGDFHLNSSLNNKTHKAFQVHVMA